MAERIWLQPGFVAPLGLDPLQQSDVQLESLDGIRFEAHKAILSPWFPAVHALETPIAFGAATDVTRAVLQISYGAPIPDVLNALTFKKRLDLISVCQKYAIGPILQRLDHLLELPTEDADFDEAAVLRLFSRAESEDWQLKDFRAKIMEAMLETTHTDHFMDPKSWSEVKPEAVAKFWIEALKVAEAASARARKPRTYVAF